MIFEMNGASMVDDMHGNPTGTNPRKFSGAWRGEAYAGQMVWSDGSTIKRGRTTCMDSRDLSTLGQYSTRTARWALASPWFR